MNPLVRGEGEDEDVKKKALPFSPINTDFSLDIKTKVARHVPRIAFQHFLVPSLCSTFEYFFENPLSKEQSLGASNWTPHEGLHFMLAICGN